MAGDSPFARAFNCESCGAPQQLHAFGQSTTYACPACGAMFDVTQEPFKLLKQSQKVTAHFDLALGSMATFWGEKFQLIGMMIRSDPTHAYRWREYLLFNPFKGFRWLMEMDGHWNFISPISNTAAVSRWGSSAEFDGRTYQLFLKDNAVVLTVYGEFYWRVKVGDTTGVKDYIAPPYILSLEKEDDEVNVSHGVYMLPTEVAEAFGIRADGFPFRTGIAPNQPAPGGEHRTFVLLATAMFLAFVTIAQLFFIGRSSNSLVMEQSIPLTVGPFISPLFTMSRHGNIEVSVAAQVSNSWVSVEFDVLDSKAQEVAEGSVEVSFYTGRDSDGAWSEGGLESHTVLGDIPAGQYYLSLVPTLPPDSTLSAAYLTVRQHVPYWPNYLIAVLLLGVPGVLFFIRIRMFEAKRWQNSDFGPGE